MMFIVRWVECEGCQARNVGGSIVDWYNGGRLVFVCCPGEVRPHPSRVEGVLLFGLSYTVFSTKRVC